MARGHGGGVQQVPSIWGPLSADQIAEAEAAAVAEARAEGRDVEMFADLTPAERRAARERALSAERR